MNGLKTFGLGADLNWLRSKTLVTKKKKELAIDVMIKAEKMHIYLSTEYLFSFKFSTYYIKNFISHNKKTVSILKPMTYAIY